MDEHKQLAYYRLSAEDTLEQLGTTREGFSASTAREQLSKFGFNELKQVHKESAVHKYLRQFKDLMILLLIASSIISLVIGDARTAIALFALMLLNTLIGFSQEFKAEKLMESLEKLVVAEAKVKRDGKLEEVATAELVPGDVVYIEEGDSVPADLRIIEESELSTNDFALTGESNPSRKFTHAISSDVELANRHNLVFMGTTVATGHAYGAVVGTGMQTELGRIANLSADTKSDLSPLQREMGNIATRVTQGTVLLCCILLPVAIKTGLPFKDALLFAIGFASSIIPNGLPAAVNTALARSANKLVKARALVKKLSAVETLGATSIICTDKTGTLTKNEMSVQELLIGQKLYSVTGSGYEASGAIVNTTKDPLTTKELAQCKLFFVTGAMASNATVNPPDDEHSGWYVVGDPTEGALITLARKADVEPVDLDKQYPELKEFSFDSARKRMSSIRAYGPNKQLYVFVKGAPESVLECSSSYMSHDGAEHKLAANARTLITKQNMTWAEGAMRNLAFAYKKLPANTDIQKLKMEDAESDLTFLGMVSMIDPLRDEVAAAMQDAHAAHIKISIITGDFAPTAKAIALRAGLADASQEITVVSGEELRKLDDSRIVQLVSQGGVIFSRVSPEDKLRIVGLVKESGHVVAVTGDGINDAPALKRADIGVAMGRTGTDVAKQSAEIVLLDDSFHTLVGAVQQGRVIFHNIKKSTLSAFSSNTAELFVNLFSLAGAIALGIPLALSVMLILAIDLIAELFPIAALGWDQAENDLMHEQPRNLHDHILNRNNVLGTLWYGFLVGSLAFGNYLLFFYRHGVSPYHLPQTHSLLPRAMALTYLTMVLCLFVNTLQLRTNKGLFTRYQLHNRALFVAFAMSLFCVINIIYNPWISPYFGTEALHLTDWLYALAAVAIFTVIREVQLHADRHHSRDTVVDLYHQKFTRSQS